MFSISSLRYDEVLTAYMQLREARKAQLTEEQAHTRTDSSTISSGDTQGVSCRLNRLILAIRTDDIPSRTSKYRDRSLRLCR